jgi:hypothetical protein
MDMFDATAWFFGLVIAWLAIDQYLIFLHHTTTGELIKKLYTKIFG